MVREVIDFVGVACVLDRFDCVVVIPILYLGLFCDSYQCQFELLTLCPLCLS